MFRRAKSNSSASEKLHRIVEDAPSGVTETQKRLVLSTEMGLLPMGFLGASYGHPKACSPRHYEYNGLSAKSSQALRTACSACPACSACHGCGTRRAQPLAELSPAERSEASAVNCALRARIRRKLEAIKQEAIQLPRISCLGRRESVLSTYGIFTPLPCSSET